MVYEAIPVAASVFQFWLHKKNIALAIGFHLSVGLFFFLLFLLNACDNSPLCCAGDGRLLPVQQCWCLLCHW